MNNHVYNSPNNRKGLILICLLLVLIHGIGVYYGGKNELQIIEKKTIDHTPSDSIHGNDDAQEKGRPFFDPNTASLAELQNQGLSKYIAKNLISYRATGWRMKEPEDIMSVYGMDDEMYILIKDRIRISSVGSLAIEKSPIKKIDKSTESVKTEARIKSKFDPNTASIEELKAQGFSNYAAKSLRAYVQKGGRIKSLADLKRIYGMDEELFDSVKERVLLPIAEVDESKEIIAADISSKPALVATESFDPNTADLPGLLRQGIDRKTAYSLINWRDTGARIRKKEDMKKIYGLTDSVYNLIQERIVIRVDSIQIVENNSMAKDSSEFSDAASEEIVIYNLNNVTKDELLRVKGIGEYYATAIIEYGDKLGGYYSIEQLKEVPALRPEHYEQLKDQFVVDGNIKRLIITSLKFKELLRHPYVDYELAKRLFKLSNMDYEEQIQELIGTGVIEERLVPYVQKY